MANNQQPQDVDMASAPPPQTEPMSVDQVPNSAGGFVWAVDDMRRFRRFLILGSEGGNYYINQTQLSRENATALLKLIAAGKGPEVVETIRQFSVDGRCAKQDPLIFALAMCARCAHRETQTAAYAILNEVLRIPTFLFTFVENCEKLSSFVVNGETRSSTGWGRAHRRAIRKWYTERQPRKLTMAITKYKQRGGWSHKDLLKLCHIKPDPEKVTPGVIFVIKYLIKGLEAVKEDAGKPGVSKDISDAYAFLETVEQLPSMEEGDILKAIDQHGLVREHIPTKHLNSKDIWLALLQKMPQMAMIRNLGKMTSVGVLEPLTEGADKVIEFLGDKDRLKGARIHPFNVLLALKQYQAGHGDKGKLSWTPNRQIVSALDKAFYKSFKFVEPTNKRYLLAIDVSGSMSWGGCCGASSITPRVAAAAMAMVTARTEPQYYFVGFSHRLVPLNLGSEMELDEVIKTIEQVPMGGTDCAQPMLYAKEKKLKVDVFIVYTDCETYAGPVHPYEALKQYRAESGIDAKLIIVAMTSNGFTLADPSDSGMLDIAGFDSAAPEIMRQFAMGEI